MRGHEVIEALAPLLEEGDVVVSSNGNISREAFHLLPRPQVYLRGSMGLPVSVGLGLALGAPKRRVIVLVGDGNFLMGLGSSVTAAHYRPDNLKILILDNASYFTTGGQQTVSSTVDYDRFLASLGLAHGRSVKASEERVASDLTSLLTCETMAALHLEIDPGRAALPNIPWHPEEIARRFLGRQVGRLSG